MPNSFTTTQVGASADYIRYVHGQVVKSDRKDESVTLDFSLAKVDDNFVKLNRGAYIVVDTEKYPKWFTGVVTSEPELAFLGKDSDTDQPVFGYKYRASSDEFTLSLKPLGFVPPFLNRTQGAIIKELAELLEPGVFDLSNVQDGPIVSQFSVDPDKKFMEVVQEFSKASNYRFYGHDKKLYYVPKDSGPIIVDADNTHFTPARLSLRPSAEPVVNDAIVLGDVEPQNYVHEYFMGTGLDSAFPLISSVYGVDSSVLIDESFSGGLNGSLWTVQDSAPGFFAVSDGYLNCTGGAGLLSTYVLSTNAVPLEGRLRITHGEFDFLSGQGVVGGLWKAAPSSGLSGCVYGLNVNGTALSAVVNGSLTGNSITLDFAKRYVIRTVAEFGKTNRLPQTYSYLDNTGSRQQYDGVSESDSVVWSTVISEVDPSNGSLTNQWKWVDSGTVSSSELYAQYSPISSTNLHCTVTGITISVPLAVSLELATQAPLANLSLDNWSNGDPDGWNEWNEVYEEAFFSFSGKAAKLQWVDGQNTYLSQNVGTKFDANKTYEVSVRLRRTNDAVGLVKIILFGTDVNETGLYVSTTEIDNAEYRTFTGTLTAPIPVVPADLKFVLGYTGSAGAVWVDDISIISEWTPQIVGPNELDALDGFSSVATVVGGTNGADTKSTMFGTGQFNPGQHQLVFFKDTLNQTSSVVPKGSLFRVSYRSAGPAVGRVRNQESINSESEAWGDNGVRSSFRTEFSPRPRTSAECELAAAALVAQSSVQHYEGTYEQFSDYFDTEPRAGAVFRIDNAEFASLVAEEITQVTTTWLSANRNLFNHVVEFGRPDYIARQVAQFYDPKTSLFQRNPSVSSIQNVYGISAGTAFASDVTHPLITGWDMSEIHVDVGQDLGSGKCFEVRYTDEGWGCDDGKNLVLRSTDREFNIPRNERGRVFYIRQVNYGNYFLWSENLTSAGVSGVTRALGVNPDGKRSEIDSIALTANVARSISVPTPSGSSRCLSLSVKGTAGTLLTLTFGSGSENIRLCGQWQRVSIGSSTSASSLSLEADAFISLSITRVSLEVGTTSERVYTKTRDEAYGPTSRYSAVVRVELPIDTTEISDELVSPGNVTLGTPKLDYEERSGVWNAVITIPVTPPTGDTVFDRMFVFLQAPDDAVDTQKTGLSETEAAFYIDDDPDTASKMVSISDPELKFEQRWNPEEPVIKVSYPEPKQSEDWRIIVVSGSKYVRNPLNRADSNNPSPSVKVTVTPHSGGANAGEWFPNARNVTGTMEYVKRRGAEQWWRWKLAWEHPTEDPRFKDIAYWDIIRFAPDIANDPATPQDDRYALVTGEPVERTQYSLDGEWKVPDVKTTYPIYVVPRGADGKRNSIAEGVTGSYSFTVERQSGDVGAENADLVTDVSATWSYAVSPATGRKVIEIPTTCTLPVDSKNFGGFFIEHWRSDYPELDWRAITDTSSVPDRVIYIEHLPASAITVKLRWMSVDSDGTPNTYVEGVTPEVSLDVQPPSVAIPVSDVTGVSVEYTYLDPDYYGKKVLRLTPTFTAPNDPSWAFVEFWAKREDGNWYLLGYPNQGGIPGAAILESLPSTSYDWEFVFVAQDVDSRNRDGEVTTVPPLWPAGTPTFTLTIAPDDGKLDGHKIENIPAAAFAAGLSATHIGTSLPPLPDATTYPPGTLFIQAPGGGVTPKVYRVNAAGSGWTAAVDGGDITARTIFGASLVTGAVATAELTTSEILVGPGGSRPVRFVVRDLLSNLLCMIGEDSSIPFQGAYFRNIKIAPGILSTDKYLSCDGSTLKMVGGTFDLALNNTRTRVTHDTVVGGSFAGLLCESLVNQDRVAISPGRVFLRDSAGNDRVDISSSSSGGVTLLNGASIDIVGGGVYKYGGSSGVAFQNIVVDKFGGGTYTISIRGGLITQII